MHGLWLSQEELDNLAKLVGQLRYVEALPIIQLLNASAQRTAARRPTPPVPTPEGVAIAPDAPAPAEHWNGGLN